MAERRMFAKTIVLSDAFLDMPITARCLYFTLGMVADDDGFVNSPKSIMRQIRASEGDMMSLVNNKFIIPFDSGIVVIKHWRVNNYLRNDRYCPTKYDEEKGMITAGKNGVYHYGIPNNGIPSIGKVSIGKLSEVKESKEENNNTCSQQSEDCTELTADVEAVILNTGQEWRPTVEQYKEFKRLYPNVDVDAEFRNMRAWCIANPLKRKTAKGVMRFINSWLARTQDRPKKGIEHNTQLDQWANA